MMKQSKILESISETVDGLCKAGVIDQMTLREFEQLCLLPLPSLDQRSPKVY